MSAYMKIRIHNKGERERERERQREKEREREKIVKELLLSLIIYQLV